MFGAGVEEAAGERFGFEMAQLVGRQRGADRLAHPLSRLLLDGVELDRLLFEHPGFEGAEAFSQARGVADAGIFE